MKLKNIIKLGTVISVLLFGLAAGYFIMMRLDMAERNRDVNLYSYIPSECVSVLESDDVNTFLNDAQLHNYNRELDAFRFPGLFDFLLASLNEYTTANGHGLSNQMSRLAVSFHRVGGMRDQVVYFRMGMADEQMLAGMLQEYASGHFLPREEKYRGKTIHVYPLGTEEFLSAYAEEGAFAISYQKSLIEKVIDAKLDKTSLNEDDLFLEMVEKKKGQHTLSLYSRTPAMPFLEMGAECWSEFVFYLNSDVFYLTGDTYMAESATVDEMLRRIHDIGVVRKDGLIISSEKDSTELIMNQVLEDCDTNSRSLFEECVANLSNESMYTFVADMQVVADEPHSFENYLPSFVIDNASLLRRFILSTQLSLNGNRPSHIWVFTYKD